MKKNFLPIAIDISGEKILIVGGGSSALKKLEILHRFGAEVEVLALKICPEIRQSGIVVLRKGIPAGTPAGIPDGLFMYQ
jgi:precorrin-2 dehydrogenase / sirohydrochlorin ferrochelatase